MKSLAEIYFNLYIKLPFLPHNPIASLYRLYGISDWRRVYKYIKPKTDDEVIKSIMELAWNGHFKVRPGTTPRQLETLLECVKATKNLNGNIIELGTYKGGTAIHLVKYLNTTDDKRTIFLCDTFEGFPYDDENSKNIFAKKGYLKDTSKEKVFQLFTKNSLENHIEIIKGKFEDTLFQKLDHKLFSLVFIDCDFFQSGRIALDFVTKHIEKNGIVCIHDFDTTWGIKKAIPEFLEKSPPKFLVQDIVDHMAVITNNGKQSLN